jgi:peptidoglycan/xylan/chitin deacetylase (PgdA/CDA1 family)
MNKKHYLYRYFLKGSIVSMLLLVIGCGGASKGLELETPSYHVGSRIIFRMDDAEKGVREQVVEQIVRVFEKNNVPVDVGIIPYSGEQPKYRMPFLKKFFDAGVIGISMHGFRHVEYEFDTAKSGSSYDQLLSNLIKARELFKNYYGITPVSLTVPYDFFNEEGYRAAQAAGFKLFCTQKSEDMYPSVLPVDYFGNRDEKGMTRLSTMNDVAIWDSKKKKYKDTFLTNSELIFAIERGLNNLGVAVISIHPDAFADEDNNAVPARITRLDAIVKLSKKYGKLTTFQEWYEEFVGKVSKGDR